MHAFKSLHHLLHARAAELGERPFLHYQDQTYSFAEMLARSRRVATGLARLGVGRGDKVAILINNCPEFLWLIFGLSMLGAVQVPLNTAHRGTILAYMLNRADCRWLVLDSEYLDQVAAVSAQVPGVETCVLLGDYTNNSNYNTAWWAVLVDNPGDVEEVDVGPADLQSILFTSGTTGPSKGAMLPQNYGLTMAEYISTSGAYVQDDCLYNALPLFHGNAQLLSTLPALMVGARMVLAERFSVSRFWDEVRRYGCTEFNYIGSIIAMLMKAERRADDRDNSLRVMIGAGCPANLFEPFEERFGVRLVEGYGMSEIGIPLTNSYDNRRPGSCGRVHPDYEVRLVDDAGRDLGPDCPGELLIRPRRPHAMMLGYYGMPEETVEAWRDLWFHTGDYLRYDTDGYYYFLDRKKDAIRRRGENISSFEVEREINAHPSVLESAAVAVASELGEDEVLVCVTPRPDADISPDALWQHCESRMASFMVPRYLRFMPELPKTPTQRVQKFRLREQGLTEDTYDREQFNG